jgi:carbamoyltransferase
LRRQFTSPSLRYDRQEGLHGIQRHIEICALAKIHDADASNEKTGSIHLLGLLVIIYGVSANEHDGALAVARDDKILFASHSERYSRLKNDPNLHVHLIQEAADFGDPELIVWYERPFIKRLRKLWSGQYTGIFRSDGKAYLKQHGINAPVYYVGHHECHAAAGFYTSPFEEAAILVVDAIGEWDTVSIWSGRGKELKKIYSQAYPHSLGLLYSAFTQRLGFKPNEEEYIVMGMAAFGRPIYTEQIFQDFVAKFDPPHFMLRENVHRGIRWWRPELTVKADIAASIQRVAERVMGGLTHWIAQELSLRNLVLGGGVALNCVANSEIARAGDFQDIWIAPDPGDAGSSIGAIAAYRRERLHVPGPYLGHEINRLFDCQSALRALLDGDVIAVANGRAEFGPRALGNRSILVDPRRADAKTRVNAIKGREQFRPFAPVILEELAADYFDLPVKRSPYMQFVARVREPTRFPSVSHVDGTARVQTLRRDENPNLFWLLTAFYEASGCPMLLNTSLNIKGEPLVNNWADAQRFENATGIKVY